MKQRVPPLIFRIDYFCCALAILCSSAMVSLGQDASVAQTQPAQAESQEMTATTDVQEPAQEIPADQLNSLVAPIALYPDPLLAQTLAASTYPLEVIQLQQWMDRNKDLKDTALATAVAKQPWDPSVQALAAAPEVAQRLAGNIQWTTDLGNAFLAQQSDVMDAVQRMRGKAESKGTLETNSQQTVETKTVEGGKQVIVVEPAQPDVVYVPSYDPVVVYGAAPASYPYYPYTYPGYYPGMGLAWGAAGFALGAWAGGYWGNCNWGGGDININRNNNFNRNSNRNVNRGNRPGQLPARGGAGQGNRWQHNPSHRGNAPYGDRGTANKFGGTARGERGTGARGGAGNRPGGGGAGVSNRPGAGAGNRPGGGAGAANRPGGGAGNRPGGGANTRPANRPSGGSAARPSGGSGGRAPSTRPANRPSGGSSANRVGNRSVSSGNRGGSAFGSSGRSGSSARAASSRGGHSMGGGGSRGGGGRGGGGGGRRR